MKRTLHKKTITDGINSEKRSHWLEETKPCGEKIGE